MAHNLEFVLCVLRVVYDWLIENESAPPISTRVNTSPSPRGPWRAFAEAINENYIRHALWWRWYNALTPERPVEHLGFGILTDEELYAILE